MLYFIIDGYNLIKRNPQFNSSILRQGRDNLLFFIRQYADLRSKRFIIVFDGKKDISSSLPEEIGIKVEFTHTETADDYIKRIVSNFRHPNQVLVVTDDKDIANFARKKSIKVLSTHRFILQMKKDTKKSKTYKVNLPEAVKITEELRRVFEEKYNK